MNSSSFMDSVRKKRPLVLFVTNYVTVNDCANTAICAGGSPIMTDEPDDIRDIVPAASAVVINMGTLNSGTLESMILAGKTANACGIPVVFDPVGAGASNCRNKAAERILNEVKVDVIKGNAGEIGFLSGVGGNVRGVDSLSSKNDRKAVESLAAKYECIVGMSGEKDYVSNGRRTVVLSNGHPLMECVSGTGCMLSGVVGCYVGANRVSVDTVAAAFTAFSVAGEIAGPVSDGPGTFKQKMLDSLYGLTDVQFDSMRKAL